jgi:hypothetical protein
MTGEQMERAIEFILSQQAKNELGITQLTVNVNKISEQVGILSEQVGIISEKMEQGWEEMREGFVALTGGLLETKRLTEQVAELNIHTSKRVTAIEKKIKNGKKSK